MRFRSNVAGAVSGLAVIAVSSSGCSLPPSGAPAGSGSESSRAKIGAVVDGDTIKVVRGGQVDTVRLIGIDTPESKRPGVPVECGALEATSSMYELAYSRPIDSDGDGLFDEPGGRARRVKLSTDPTQDRVDRYGRLLAYVSAGDRSLQVEQLRRGWADVYVYGRRPFQRLQSFEVGAKEARKQSKGVWRTCTGDFHSKS